MSQTPLLAPALVSCQWLQQHLADPDIQIIDVSYFMPNLNRNAAAEFAEKTIPGAIFFDIDGVCDPDSDLPHMLPSADIFNAALQELGISPEKHLIFFDRLGLFSAPRGWWTFKIFGAKRLSILEGGLPAWEQAGFKTSQGQKADPLNKKPTCQFQGDKNINVEDIKQNLRHRKAQIIDARAYDRFCGTGTEPRPHLRKGHIPGSYSAPFPIVLTDDKSCFKSPEQIQQAFEAAGISLEQPIITSCGSGVTAAILSFALSLIGKDSQLYDGSWSEWGANPNLPIATI